MKYAHFIFIAGAFFMGVLFAVIDAVFKTNLVQGVNILFSAVLITLFFLFQYYWRRRNGDIFGSVDKNIFKIILAFLQEGDFKENDYYNILQSIFKSYSPSLVSKLYITNVHKKIDLKKTCFAINKVHANAKVFLLYALFDVASMDRIISKKEESFIYNIGFLIRFPSKTINYIKQQYINKGVSSEQEIERENERKKSYKNLSKSFFPYKAFKIMGLSPSVTKIQLKKAYRKLAKKYHPDKFHGQSDEIIQKTEEKFQEITEAYEIILKYKKF